MRATFKRKLQTVVTILMLTAVVFAFSSGPPAGYTGAPGDSGSCVQCHSSFGVNTGPGSVSISGHPAAYTPGQQYTLTVTVQQTGRTRFGFQLTAIDSNGDRAGLLESLGPDTQINIGTGSGGRQYVQHTSQGTNPTAAGMRVWQFRWTAPSTPVGSVRFFAAGNAANGDGGTQNDHIYTANVTSNGPPAATADLAINHTASPNPVTVGSLITYTITVTNNGPDAASNVTVRDDLPDATSFQSCASTGGGVCGGSGNNRTVTFTSLASGASATITIEARANCSAADGTRISNTARVSSATADPNANNNNSTTMADAANPTAISPTEQAFPAAGGSGAVNLTTPSACSWTAVSNASWLTVTSGASGTGNGVVNFSVAANTGPARVGTLTIAGRTFTVTQEGTSNCTYSIAPTAQAFAASAGTGSVTVTTQATCQWTAASNNDWITITGGATGAGNGAVNYSVAANPGVDPRMGTMSIAGQTFTVTQAGTGAGAAANLTLTVSTSSGVVAAGTRLTYTFAVANSGPGAADNVTVNTSTPAGATLAAITSPAAVAPPVGSTGGVSIGFGAIPAGGSATATLTVNVLVPQGATLSLNATVVSSSPDPVPGDNGAAMTTDIKGGGIVEASWNLSPSTDAQPTPAPANLQAKPGTSATPGGGAADENIAPSETCTLLGYNVYISNQPGVAVAPENLWMRLPPTALKANVPVAPAGSFYVVTAVWQCGGEVESQPSNEVNVPGGPTIDSVSVSSKLKVRGGGFSDPVEVFLDGVGFSRRAKLKSGNRQVLQKGALLDGRSIGDLIGPGKSALLTVRNSNGGMSSQKVTDQ